MVSSSSLLLKKNEKHFGRKLIKIQIFKNMQHCITSILHEEHFYLFRL